MHLEEQYHWNKYVDKIHAFFANYSGYVNWESLEYYLLIAV